MGSKSGFIGVVTDVDEAAVSGIAILALFRMFWALWTPSAEDRSQRRTSRINDGRFSCLQAICEWLAIERTDR
jgi:hypothetical protein